MKRFVLLLSAFLLIFLVCGCNNTDTEFDTESVSLPESSEIISSTSATITEEQAIEIASEHWGIKSGDKDEETGFPFLIMPVESGNSNIRIDLKWLVNGANYSTVDSVYIDPYSGEIISNVNEQ